MFDFSLKLIPEISGQFILSCLCSMDLLVLFGFQCCYFIFELLVFLVLTVLLGLDFSSELVEVLFLCLMVCHLGLLEFGILSVEKLLDVGHLVLLASVTLSVFLGCHRLGISLFDLTFDKSLFLFLKLHLLLRVDIVDIFDALQLLLPVGGNLFLEFGNGRSFS